MFRFAQRLSTILAGRDLTATEQSGLDDYDIELEDALSVTSTNDLDFFMFDSNYLRNDLATTPALTEVLLQTQPGGFTYLDLVDDGTPGGASVALESAGNLAMQSVDQWTAGSSTAGGTLQVATTLSFSGTTIHLTI